LAHEKNKYGIPELILIISSFVPFFVLSCIKKLFPKSNAFELIVEICTALVLFIYAAGIFSFAVSRLQSWKNYLKEYKKKKSKACAGSFSKLQQEEGWIESQEDPMDKFFGSDEEAFQSSDSFSFQVPNQDFELYSSKEGIILGNEQFQEEISPEIGSCPFLSWVWTHSPDFIILLVAIMFVVFAFVGSSFVLTSIGFSLFMIPMIYYSLVL
jgi:amino acid transporter